MKRILITGGAGFVGSNLALHLRAVLDPAIEIIALDNLHRRGSELNVARLEDAGVRFLRGDVRDPASLPSGRFDLLVECSAEPSVMAGSDGAVDYLFDTNLVGLYHCLERCRRDGAGLVFLSTSRVYPIAALEAHPWRETETRFEWLETGAAIGPSGVREALAMDGARSLYGTTKLAGEMLVEEYRAAFGLRAVVDRCGVIAGPWQFGKVDQGVVSLWAMAHVFGRTLRYVGYGGEGKQVRDVLHVDDLALLVADQVANLEAWDGFVGNVSGGASHAASLCELTALCREHAGRAIEIGRIAETRPNDLRIYVGDCARLISRTEWRPRRGVAEIVADTVRWVRDHRRQLEALGA
jgi:CDP-paratose 2-epimerase